MSTQSNHEKRIAKPQDILYRGLVWAFVGALYAAMFVPVFEVTSRVLPLWISAVLAAMAATAGGAMVYSSSQLAVQSALFSNIAVFVYLLSSGVVVPPLGPTVVGASIGAITGALYGLIVKKSRIYRADAKLMAGIVAGGVVSVIALAWILVLGDELVWLIALLAPISGVVYLKLVAAFVRRFSDVLPRFVDGALAGVVIGGFIGFGLWLMAGVALADVVPEWRATYTRITDIALDAIAAACITTFLMGIVKAALKLNWGDPYDQ